MFCIKLNREGARSKREDSPSHIDPGISQILIAYLFNFLKGVGFHEIDSH
jgi:hypothetical protein